MPRRRKADGKKPSRTNKAKKYRLRELLPRVGFDFADKRCHAMLSGVESATIKEHIRSFAGDLSKPLVDEALTAIFEPAIAAIKADPDTLADMMPGEFWGTIKQSLPWTSDALTGHAVFSLVVALVFSHEKYDAACPYNRFKHQYGKLAEAVHELLKQHYQDNLLVMSFYYDSSTSLPSDEEDDDDDDDDEETDVEEEEEAGPSQGQEAEAGDVAMPDYQGEEDKGEEEKGEEDKGEDRGEELAGAVKAMELD